jgi:hypothetical protein
MGSHAGSHAGARPKKSASAHYLPFQALWLSFRWTHFVVTDHLVLFYQTMTGRSETGFLTADGQYGSLFMIE